MSRAIRIPGYRLKDGKVERVLNPPPPFMGPDWADRRRSA